MFPYIYIYIKKKGFLNSQFLLKFFSLLHTVKEKLEILKQTVEIFAEAISLCEHDDAL